MAQLQLKPPGNFDFKQPDTWLKWKKRFEQFRVASDLASADETRQVSTLLYCLGEDAEEILNSTDISATDKKKYNSVVQKFDEFFHVRKNVIFERARFNRRSQLEGESVEEYLTALYSLVEACEYGNLRNDLLRDRIVVGIRDVSLSERMQLDATLTLEKAKKMVRQKEAVTLQGQQLRGDGTKGSPLLIEPVVSRRPTRSRQPLVQSTPDQGRRGRPPASSSTGTSSSECTRCGNSRHARGDRCPALETICHRCNRRGHYSTRCFSKTVAIIETDLDESSIDTAFLGELRRANQGRSWTVSLSLQEGTVPFKLDTGAEVTAIS